MGSILDGNIAEAKVVTLEGARLLEGVMAGRPFHHGPMITSRICGVCPVVHFLTSVKALEDAFGVKLTEQSMDLRKLLEHAQVIHSHGMHFFFLSGPDFVGILDDENFIKKYPNETKAALKVRDFGVKIVEKVGGRTVHPLTPEVGGFKKLPSKKDLQDLLKMSDEALKESLKLVDFFKTLKFPEFERKTKFVSLYHPKEYGIYDGDISVDGEIIKREKFYEQIKELHTGEPVKRTHYLGEPYMNGAIARINNNFKQLDKEAQSAWEKFNEKLPTFNTFYNVAAQVVETVHCIKECQKILRKLSKKELKDANVKYKAKAGKGLGSMEAPRGLLYHYFEIDKDGRIKKANVITPTAQFLANLEADLKVYLPDLKNISDEERRGKIKLLIRAYDPCISCATH